MPSRHLTPAFALHMTPEASVKVRALPPRMMTKFINAAIMSYPVKLFDAEQKPKETK